MPERPLILFPTPANVSREKLGGGTPNIYLPSHSRQGSRLTTKFDALIKAFDEMKVNASLDVLGADPECVIVFEIIGIVEDFVNAVKKIDGFDWLGEIDVEEIIPDDDFFDESNADDEQKSISGRLFLVMSNQKAMAELLALWQAYKKDENYQFPRGFGRFKEVFKRLHDIRRWDIQDRLQETGILNEWRDEIQNDPDKLIRFEIELWFRSSQDKRETAEKKIAGIIKDIDGKIISRCLIEGIAYHAFLVEIKASDVKKMLQSSEAIIKDNDQIKFFRLIHSDDIMFFKTVGQMVSGDRLDERLQDSDSQEVPPLPSGDPVVALLDGLPLSGHRLLANRLTIDDPDGMESYYRLGEQNHGTAMASLLAHGDVNETSQPLVRPIYVRPIMRPDEADFRDHRVESVPNDVLPVDVIHRAVRRMFEGDGDEPPVASSVKIINFSIGINDLPFNRYMSPLARLLDWLSYHYNVLFVVSAGNHSHPIV